MTAEKINLKKILANLSKLEFITLQEILKIGYISRKLVQATLCLIIAFLILQGILCKVIFSDAIKVQNAGLAMVRIQLNKIEFADTRNGRTRFEKPLYYLK